MKGDFTRSTFKPEKHYSGVRMQQGRVQVDADFNEYVGIQAHLLHTALGDIIGLCGGPQDNVGFEIVAKEENLRPIQRAKLEKELKAKLEKELEVKIIKELKDVSKSKLKEIRDARLKEVWENRLKEALESKKKYVLEVTKGRYYVDGILCENSKDVLITNQPDLPGQTDPAAPGKGFYLAYLDVWQRHITALEDEEIREVALGGPDTTTRTKTIWQVKSIHAIKEFKPLPLCSDPIFKFAWDAIAAPSSGQLTASVETSKEDPTKPCIVPARAGYRGLENQLYRVEVHTDDSGKETFKWSRENGSVVFPIKFDKIESGKSHITLNQLGKDKVLALHADDWVEVLGDTTELNCKPGTMAKVLPESDIDKGVIVLDGDISKHKDEANLKLRRWDHKATDKISLTNGAIPIEEGKTVLLENGVQVEFEKLIGGSTYHTGDYWLIPARTATRDIEWPREGSNAISQLPLGIHHHFCRLAVLSYDGTAWTRIHDCRRLFPPLNEMARFCYVGGDGQEAMPGNPLPRPLQVSVVNGQMCVANAKVQFKVIGGSSYLQEYKSDISTPCLNFTTGGTTTVEVQTGPSGIASACWRLDSSNLSQQVEATLIEIDGKSMLADDGAPYLPPIHFNANLSIERSCCVTVGVNGEYDRLDMAIIDLRKRRKQTDICLCMLPGVEPQVLPGELNDELLNDSELSISIAGCGSGSRIYVERPMQCTGMKSFSIRDAVIEFKYVISNDKPGLVFKGCNSVSFNSCHVSGVTDVAAYGTLLSIGTTDRVDLRDNTFEATSTDSGSTIADVVKKTGIESMAYLAATPADTVTMAAADFRTKAMMCAENLAAMKEEERAVLGKNMIAMASGEYRQNMSESEVVKVAKLGLALSAKADVSTISTLLNDIRRAAVKARPGVAVVLGEGERASYKDLARFTNAETEIAGITEDDVAQDDMIIVENNEILGVISLYNGVSLSGEATIDGFLDKLKNMLKRKIKEEKVIPTITGLQGTLEIRGNRLVGITVGRDILNSLNELADSKSSKWSLNIFARCILSENVIEGVSLIVSQHLAMATNDFALSAVAHPGEDNIPAGGSIADSSVYVGNHGCRPGVAWKDISRVSERAANLEIRIV